MNKLLQRLAWPLIASPLVYLAIVWNKLPETVALHFELGGNADRFGTKTGLLGVVLLLVVVNLLVYLLLLNVHRIDPKKTLTANRPWMQRIAFAIALFVSGITALIIYSSSHLDASLNTRIIFAGVGLLLCIIGNYMHTLKPNYFAGIRLPWTLQNEDNWRRTHLLAGKLFFGGGLFITIICLVLPTTASFIVFICITLIICIIPGIYSYRLYKKTRL